MTIRKSHLKKLIMVASLGIILWGVVAWLFITVPLFVVNTLPDLLPLSVFAFLLFLVGLLLLTIAAASLVRIIAPRYTWTVILAASSLIVLYNLSPLAPAWNCFGKRLYVATANAAGQNCTETCTNNKKKPCGGWSSCWNKDISCSASGIDQDGRPCQGCCFSCDIVCEPEPDPDRPPTITASLSCSQFGNNGWCTGTSTLNLTASDPQGYTLTISGNIGGTPFTCAQGNNCSRTLPEGNGTISYKVTASQSGLTNNGSTTWKRDVTFPTANLIIPVPTGSNGWFKTLPVTISISGADSLSGLAKARLSLDPNANRATWPSSISLTSDGIYTVYYGADDVAGNQIDYSPRLIYIDTTPPAVSSSVSGTMGANGWYVSQVVVSATATDTTSGVNTVLISDNGGVGSPSPVTLDDGIHNLTITATDKAGNSNTDSITLNVDTKGPTITPSISGTSGSNGWFVSTGTVSAAVNDVSSGVSGEGEVSFDNGSTWQSMPVTLNDGVYNLSFRAFDIAGNEGTATFTASIDTTIPSLDFAFNGTLGENGWYVSDVDVSASASDSLSGLDSFEVRTDDGSWSVIQTLSDGIHNLEARAADKAGNLNSISGTLYVDTHPPSSKFKSHSNNEVISGKVTLSGESLDALSGVSFTEISLDGGITWQKANLSNGAWSFDWDTSNLPNGSYTVQMRAIDAAGNKENPIALTLIAANFPPNVKITDSWWIWESGVFKVSTNTFPIAEIKVTISDPQNRWKPVVLKYNPRVTSTAVTWDRRFGEVIAPSGNYHATILACDIYGNCASDRGVIRIPIIAPVPPSATPSLIPTIVSTETVLPTVTRTPAPQSTPTQTLQAIVTPQTEPIVPERKELANHPAWVVAFLTLLVLLFGITSLLDPRPKALRALAKTIDQFNKE